LKAQDAAPFICPDQEGFYPKALKIAILAGHIADGIADPVPGLLSGGPNPGEQDHCHYDFHEPETAYVDADFAYASNKIAINWNAPLVYLANGIEALQNNFSITK
jgi:endoglucanase